MKSRKCKNCSARGDLVDSRPRLYESLVSAVLPYKPMRCKQCLNRGMYPESLFANKWRIALWGLIVCFLGMLILASIKTGSNSNAKKVSSHKVSSHNDYVKNDLDDERKPAASIVNEQPVSDKSITQSDLLQETANVDVNNTSFQPPVVETFVGNSSVTKKQANQQDVLKRQVFGSIEVWRSAWESGDVLMYLNAYSLAYQPEEGETYKAWKDRRTRVVGKKQNRKITVENLRLIVNEDGVTAGVQFNQSYQSGSYADNVVKRLHLKNINGSWKIVRESTAQKLND